MFIENEIQKINDIVQVLKTQQKEITRLRYQKEILTYENDWLDQLATDYREQGYKTEYCEGLYNTYLRIKKNRKNKFKELYNENL